jgi:hypothetical protein
MKNNILLVIVSLICLQAYSLNAMEWPNKPTQEQLAKYSQDQLDSYLFTINPLAQDEIKRVVEAGADIINAKRKVQVNYQPKHMSFIEYQDATGNTGNVYLLITTITPKEIQSIKPAIWAMQQNLGPSIGRDLGKNKVAKELIKDIVDKKLALAKKYKTYVPENELRKIIETNIFSALNKEPNA